MRQLLTVTMVLVAVCIAPHALVGFADPPALSQWQRRIEEERVNEELEKGHFEEALVLAKSLVADYKKSVPHSGPAKRNAITYAEAQPHLIRLNVFLARTARIVGDYKLARSLLEKVDGPLGVWEGQAKKAANVLEFQSQMFDLQLLAAIDNANDARGKNKVSNLVIASAASTAASMQSDRVMQQLAEVVWLRASLYDEYGVLELDVGKNRHAESLFRKSAEYYGHFRMGSGSKSVHRKHLRNYARLYIKDAEEFLREKKAGEAAAALDRAEVYLGKAADIFGDDDGAPSRAGDAESRPSSFDRVEWERADLHFQFGEYHVARADLYTATENPTLAKKHLDDAERAVVHSLDRLNRLVPANHPFLAYCFLELAGLNARQAILTCETAGHEALALSYGADAIDYWKKTQEVIAGINSRPDSPLLRLLEIERPICKQSHELLKKVVASDRESPGAEESEQDIVESATFPSVGSKVRRGPDWSAVWGDVDGGEDEAAIGTIVRIEDDGWLAVKWHKNGRVATHRPGGDGRDDLVDLDGNTAAARPVATDMSDGGVGFGRPGVGYPGNVDVPGFSRGSMPPPGVAGPPVPVGASAPGYPIPGSQPVPGTLGTPGTGGPPPGPPVPGYGPPNATSGNAGVSTEPLRSGPSGTPQPAMAVPGTVPPGYPPPASRSE